VIEHKARNKKSVGKEWIKGRLRETDSTFDDKSDQFKRASLVKELDLRQTSGLTDEKITEAVNEYSITRTRQGGNSIDEVRVFTSNGDGALRYTRQSDGMLTK